MPAKAAPTVAMGNLTCHVIQPAVPTARPAPLEITKTPLVINPAVKHAPWGNTWLLEERVAARIVMLGVSPT